MAAFLGNLRNVVIASFTLAILLVGVYCSTQGYDGLAFELFVLRWLHVVAGVMWIGLLWYFNFVQIPTMPKVPDELKKGVSGYIAPAALFWFRWAAMATFVLGIILALRNNYLLEAY
ncbi:MAG TPA: urate hydroxylase PuuD, partial [Rhizomicrobium sp.]|nr:urate hydroxylase PuuD [Rhizomicrobium sp.]